MCGLMPRSAAHSPLRSPADLEARSAGASGRHYGSIRGRVPHPQHNCCSPERKLLRATALPHQPQGQHTLLCYAGQGQGHDGASVPPIGSSTLSQSGASGKSGALDFLLLASCHTRGKHPGETWPRYERLFHAWAPAPSERHPYHLVHPSGNHKVGEEISPCLHGRATND